MVHRQHIDVQVRTCAEANTVHAWSFTPTDGARYWLAVAVGGR
jgi:hypothetical protein